MTTNEAIDRLRKCGVEGLPYQLVNAGRWYAPSALECTEHDAELIAFALGVQRLRDNLCSPTIFTDGIRSGPYLFRGNGNDLANVVAAVEAAEGRKNG